ncbi:MAG: AAA family ATPase [bacterium]|nr:AAA family ATPase [bacterium]
MKLVILMGDAAVGKMTVGQELMKLTDLRLFHNHMTIEPVIEIFGNFNGEAIRRMREIIFEEYAKTDNYGMIFTYMWAFDMQSDWDYIDHVCDIFKTYHKDTEFIYVELVAPQEIRLKRNVTPNRLHNKASKRDIEESNQRLIRDDNNHRCVSNEGELPFENYIRIDNTNLSPEEVAAIIKDKFHL